MFSPFERMMAGRYLRARRREGFISVIAGFSFLGIMLGVATLIVVMAVMNGFRHEFIGRILGLNGHLYVQSASGGPLGNFDALADELRRIEGVVSVAPKVEGQALLTVQSAASGVVVRGMRQGDFGDRPILGDSIVQGRLDDFIDDRVIVGVRMAERLNLRPGDYITLVAPEGKASPFGTIPRSRRYPVAAIFDVGMYEYNNSYIFMPLAAAQVFFRKGEGVSELDIMTTDPDGIDVVRAGIERTLGGSVRVVDWRQVNGSFANALQVERNVMFLILTLIIVVAAFNIISSLIMLVKDKGRGIAVLRTMGATKGSIMRIFLLTGGAVGVSGTVFGTLLGIVFALNIENIRRWLESLSGTELFADEIYFLSQLPARIEWSDVVTIVLMALALSFAATIYPSWRAARLDPVEALRYE